MREWRKTASLAAAAAAALILLALAPAGWARPEAAGSSFAESAPRRMTGGNLVDFLLQSPLAAPIVRTEWEWTLLSVDLSADDPALTREAVMRDLYTLTERAFRTTTNVQQTLIRVVVREPGGRGEQVIAVLYAKRDQWKHPAFGMPEQPVHAERWLAETYKLTMDADAWDRRRGG
ncbi:hypothetical protein ACFQWB_11015 [Paenibacillus thermoaerophilus]|uniref:Uncharacterized protein n=1 Tax=Paenibacillus thermoaerophilus TaxID=1215385 RepID=A0ABW2V766_9BACL|nr:hypothetical protein [Paenibacillus thermoaerophilus]TMV18713.1 hypothetical protein FE781_01880 [Paenibacillus thermoaerophilus]